MQTSEPFLPFTRNLLCKRIRFDDKLDLIDKIIPIDQTTCLIIDRARNFHLKVYSPEDEDAASLQFPLPPYAHNNNPNVLYSVDYTNLYHFINQKKISADHVQNYIYNLDQQRTKYIQFVCLGDYKLAVQLNSDSPVAILDLCQPKNPPVILQNVFAVKNLISVGHDYLAWYEKSANLVVFYHMISRKRKILNFTELSIKELYSLKDHVIIAVSVRQIEILDYAKNRVIKSIGFINDVIIPDVVVHSEANLISYLEGSYIHILKTEKGRIKWENYYEFTDYDEFATYRFVTDSLIALATKREIKILYLDSKSVAVHTVITNPMLGVHDEPGFEHLCCGDASLDGIIWDICALGNERFSIVECVCRENFYSHGQQRVSVFKLENLRAENAQGRQLNVDLIKFEVSKSIIFEEFRESIRAIDVFDENFGMFITEKAKLFRVNLKDYSAKLVIELRGLVKRGEIELSKIDKLYILAENRVAITTKTDSSLYSRIVVFALEKRTVDFDSNDLMEEDEETARFSFYGVTKLRSNTLFVSFKKVKNSIISSGLGKIHDYRPGEYDGYSFREYRLDKKDRILYDRLWDLEGSLIAMRHGGNVFHLTFMDEPDKTKTSLKLSTKSFRAETYLSVANIHTGGVLDVKLINKNVACLQIKANHDQDETVILVYNIEKEELLHKMKTSTSLIGTMRHCYLINEKNEEFVVRNRIREKMMLFGRYRAIHNSLIFKPVKDLMNKQFDEIKAVGQDVGFNISPSNFKALKTQDHALVYEIDHHKNFICVLKSPKFQLECLRVFQSAVGNTYHKYIYQSVFETIFGVNEN